EVYEVIEEQDAFFIVQGYTEGLTLADARHGARPLNIPDVFRKIAEGLQQAHHHDLIHGNLTPSEIMIDGKGNPHLQFPGIPRIGTPAYVAPEQLAGTTNQHDGRVDIWSVGVMLYECLAERRPFERSMALMSSIQDLVDQAPAPPRQYKSDIPRDLEQ